MHTRSLLQTIITLLAVFVITGCGGSSGSATSDQGKDLKTIVEHGIQKLYNDWSAGRTAKDTSALAGAISTNYLSDGLTYQNRVAALRASIDDYDFSSYTLTLESLDSYDKTFAVATGHYVYNFTWIPGGCDVARDFSSQGYFRSDDEGVTWQSVGNQSVSFRTPTATEVVTSTGYTSDACLAFADRVSGEKTAFYPTDPKVYGLVHFTNLLGDFTGWREWVKPNGQVYSRTDIDLTLSSDSYSAVAVGGSLGIVGYGNFWSANQGEWTFRGEITGATGTVSFSTKFSFYHRVPSRANATAAYIQEIGEPAETGISTVLPQIP